MKNEAEWERASFEADIEDVSLSNIRILYGLWIFARSRFVTRV